MKYLKPITDWKRWKSESTEDPRILMDVMMPKMDGIQAIMHIRETSNIPIIILSAKSEDMDKVLG